MCGVHRGDEGITSDENVITYRESRTLVPSRTLVSDEWNRHLSMGYISHISDSPRHSFISTCFAYESSIFFASQSSLYITAGLLNIRFVSCP